MHGPLHTVELAQVTEHAESANIFARNFNLRFLLVTSGIPHAAEVNKEKLIFSLSFLLKSSLTFKFRSRHTNKRRSRTAIYSVNVTHQKLIEQTTNHLKTQNLKNFPI